ncbi:MAG: permease [Actinomycetota bacterium]
MGGTVFLLAELAVLFFGVAFLVQIVQRRLGGERLRSWMGGHPLVSALKGIAIGFVTPFCTYSAIPMLVGFRQAGVPPAGYVAFLSAAPVLDPVLFGALVLIVGMQAALIYSAIAFVGAMTLALTAQRIGIDRHLKPLPAELTASSCSTTDQDDAAWLGVADESRRAARAAVSLLRSVGPLLLVGVSIGLLIEALVSPDAVATITGSNAGWSIPLAAGLGTPLYFQTSLFVPIAHSLTAAGVGIGAIVALTISGAGANIPEFVILTKLANRALIAVFGAYVFAVALLGGLTAQALLG